MDGLDSYLINYEHFTWKHVCERHHVLSIAIERYIIKQILVESLHEALHWGGGPVLMAPFKNRPIAPAP